MRHMPKFLPVGSHGRHHGDIVLRRAGRNAAGHAGPGLADRRHHLPRSRPRSSSSATSEITGNTYERLINYDPKDVSKIYGEVAESWTVSPDGKTFTFKIRPNKKFASGNPLTAEDVVFSLQRAVILDKSPAFILGQFGLTKDNVKDKIKQTGPLEFTMELDKAYAPTFVLYCLTAPRSPPSSTRSSSMQNEKDGDFGYNWLKTQYAGSGPFTIRDWKANEVVVLERNPNYEKKTPLARVIYRHIKETATQRLLLEKGDVDIARNLNPEELDAVVQEPGHQGRERSEGHGLLSRPEPEEPEPRQARGAPGAEVSRRLFGHRRHDHEEQGRGSSGLPAEGLPRRRQRQSLQARRRQGEGASREGRPEGRLLGDDGHPLDRRKSPASRRRSSRPSRRPASSSRSSPATASRR